MPRYSSCKNCPAYKHAFLSKTEGNFVLQFKYSEDENRVMPLEDCTKPKNIIEMNIFAQKRGVEFPGCDMLTSEKEYNVKLHINRFETLWQRLYFCAVL